MTFRDDRAQRGRGGSLTVTSFARTIRKISIGTIDPVLVGRAPDDPK
jgi:hypothetical protein